MEIVGENDFGNLILKDIKGKYWRLCPEDVYCEVVAENREELDALSTDQKFLEDWYMKALVEVAKDKLGPLEEGRKYYLVVLGGEYGMSNIKTAPLAEIIRFSGDIGKQIKDLPDGAQIKLKIIDLRRITMERCKCYRGKKQGRSFAISNCLASQYPPYFGYSVVPEKTFATILLD